MTEDPGHTTGRRRLARTVMARHARSAVNVTTIAAAASRAYEDLAQVLAPIIGDVGVAAMTDRALHLATRETRGSLPASPARPTQSSRMRSMP